MAAARSANSGDRTAGSAAGIPFSASSNSALVEGPGWAAGPFRNLAAVVRVTPGRHRGSRLAHPHRPLTPTAAARGCLRRRSPGPGTHSVAGFALEHCRTRRRFDTSLPDPELPAVGGNVNGHMPDAGSARIVRDRPFDQDIVARCRDTDGRHSVARCSRISLGQFARVSGGRSVVQDHASTRRDLSPVRRRPRPDGVGHESRTVVLCVVRTAAGRVRILYEFTGQGVDRLQQPGRDCGSPVDSGTDTQAEAEGFGEVEFAAGTRPDPAGMCTLISPTLMSPSRKE